MNDNTPPSKRPKYDLTNVFEVVVGKTPSSQRFTLHSNIFTARSGFFKAALKPEWLTDPTKPVDLQHEEPEVFSRYLNCVYCGTEALQIEANAPGDDREYKEDSGVPGLDAFLYSETEHATFRDEGLRPRGDYVKYLGEGSLILTDLYLLADRLRDMQTANLVMDELIRFSQKGNESFTDEVVRRTYDATAHGNPLRKLLRDECVYTTNSMDYRYLHVDTGHPEFTRDVMVEFIRLRDYTVNEKVADVYTLHDNHRWYTDKCHYHQHDETYPRCVPEPGKEGKQSTE